MTMPRDTSDEELIHILRVYDEQGSLSRTADSLEQHISWVHRRVKEAERRGLTPMSSAEADGYIETIESFKADIEKVRRDLAKVERERDSYKKRYEIAKNKHVKVDCIRKGGKVGSKVVDKVLLVPDIHSQFVDWSALQVCLDFKADWKPTKTVQMGDLLDCEAISSFPKDQALTLREEFDIGEHILDILKPTHYCEGNHEERIQRQGLVDRSIRSLLSVKDNLHLEARGIEHLEYRPNLYFEFGKLNVLHGNKCSDNAAKAHAEAYGCVAFCHTHRIQSYTKRSIGHRSTGFNVGTLTPESLGYCSTVTGWQQGFAFAYIMDDGDFSFYQVRMIGAGPFIIEGKEYERHETCKPDGFDF